MPSSKRDRRSATRREQVAANYKSLDDLPKYLVDMLIDQQ
jgi:hypothetical protein